MRSEWRLIQDTEAESIEESVSIEEDRSLGALSTGSARLVELRNSEFRAIQVIDLVNFVVYSQSKIMTYE